MFKARRTRLTTAFILFVLLSSLALAGCAGPRGWPGTYAENDVVYAGSADGGVLALNPDSGSRKWEWSPEGEQTAGLGSCACPGGAGGGSFASGMAYGDPIVSNGLVYITSYSGKVYVIDDGNGVELYDCESAVVGSVAVGNDTLFVGSSDGRLHAIDIATGEIKPGFPFQAGGKIWSTPTVHDNTVYFGSLDHKLYALDAETGEQRWDKPFEAGGSIASTPIVVDGVVYIGSFDRNFYAVDAGTGKLLWAFPEAGNWYWSNAIYNNGRIYTGCLDHKIYAIDAEKGDLAWPKPFESSAPVKSSPVIVGDLLVLASEDGKIWGLDLQTGEEIWGPFDLGAKVLANLSASGDKVYINTQNNELFALDGATGRQDWSIPLIR